MHRLVNAATFRDTVHVLLIRVIPASLKLLQFSFIRSISINLVGAHVTENGFWRKLACCFQKIERPVGIDLEIQEWNFRSTIMAGLRRAVNDQVWMFCPEKLKYGVPVSDIDWNIAKLSCARLQLFAIPFSTAVGTEEC